MQEEAVSGQGSLFGQASAANEAAGADGAARSHARPALPNLAPWSESERLTKEKEILGFYTSGHPLEPFRTECEIFTTNSVADLGAWSKGQMTLGVVITAVKKQLSKKSGKEFARLVIEDFSGSAEVLVFPDTWANASKTIETDIPMLLTGAFSDRDESSDNPAFILEKAERLAEKRATGQVTVAIELPRGLAPGVINDLRAIVDLYPGNAPIELQWSDGERTQRLRSRSLRVGVDGALGALRGLLGEASVHLQRAV